MVHKPKHKVHSFRGLLGDGGQDEINLERQNVNLAYRIVKLRVIGPDPRGSGQETVLKVYTDEQSSITDAIDFTDTSLLGVAFYESSSSQADFGGTEIIFDNTLFSRNIFITSSGDASLNYYIEIEEVPVGAATLMQLKLAVARKLSLTQ